MTTKSFGLPGILLVTGCLYCMGVTLCAEPPGNEPGNAKGQATSATNPPVKSDPRVSVAVARDRARLMHEVYLATLNVMHERYFHNNRAVVPARAMEDIFSEIKHKSKIDAHWISVNMDPMSVNHEPKTEFEKRAAKEIAEGKVEYEVVKGGYYRRAGVIPLASGCVNCHGGFFKEHSKAPKFAGLVISVPIIGNSDDSK